MAFFKAFNACSFLVPWCKLCQWILARLNCTVYSAIVESLPSFLVSLSLLLDRNNSVGFILFYICILVLFYLSSHNIFKKKDSSFPNCPLLKNFFLLVLFLLTYSCHFQSMCYKVSFIYTHPILFLYLHLFIYIYNIFLH